MKQILPWLLVRVYLAVLLCNRRRTIFGDDRFEDAILFKKNKHTNKTE